MGCPVGELKMYFVFCSCSFNFFSNLSSVFNIWGVTWTKVWQYWLVYFIVKMSISMCLMYRLFLCIGLFFCLVPVGVFICSSTFGELNIYNYLISLEILPYRFLDNLKFKRLLCDIILLWHTSAFSGLLEKYFYLDFPQSLENDQK